MAAPPPLRSVSLVLFSALGLFASFMLVEAELELLRDPGANLGCDINPLLACSDSLLTPQAHLLGVSNSLIGTVAFAALTALAVVLAAGAALPRLLWWGLGAGTFVGFVYVLYFLFLSVSVFRALCPYCMLTWVATTGALVIVWSTMMAAGMLGKRAVRTGRSVGRYWALSVLGTLLLFLLVIVVTLKDQIGMLL